MMENHRMTSENELLAAQRRASEALVEGVGAEIEALHVMNVVSRAQELFFFVILYSIGFLSVWFAQGSLVVSLMGILCMGVALNSAAIFLHEGLHGLLAVNPKMNHLFSFIAGMPMMLSATAYRVTHTHHHYELGRKLDYGTYRQHLKNPALIWGAYGVQLVFGTIVYVACIPFLAFRVASRRARLWMVMEYLVMAGVYFVIFQIASWGQLSMYWLYPLIISSVLTNIRGVASHALGDVENIYLSSRTVKSSPWVSFLFMYENYHLEHHLFPSVPSYNLRKMHNLIWNRLPEAIYSRTYLQFLRDLLKAAIRNDLNPMGVVRPASHFEFLNYKEEEGEVLQQKSSKSQWGEHQQPKRVD
ncbi:MAG: fatty acid desaturase [Verrucomicrobiota bacterium]